MSGTPRKIEFSVAPAPGGGFAVLAAGRPARTPRGNDLVVPSRALAETIRDELPAMPGALAGRGLNDPAAAAHFRIASGAIDVLAADAAARARLEADLVGYGDTDLVCYRSPRPDALAAREDAAWNPVCAWFRDAFAVELVTTTGFETGLQDARLADVLAETLATMDAFRLAAVALAIKAAGSVAVGLALAHGRIGADEAFEAITVGESFQEETWGIDKEARAARAVKRLDLEQAARFLALLEEKR